MNEHEVNAIRTAAETARRYGRDTEAAAITAARQVGVDEATINEARQIARHRSISLGAAFVSMSTPSRQSQSRTGGVW